MTFSHRRLLVGGGVVLLLVLAIVGISLTKISSVEKVRARCYEQALQRRQVVSTNTSSDAYLDQITEDALHEPQTDAAAFVACQQAAHLTGTAVQTLPTYEAANHFTK